MYKNSISIAWFITPHGFGHAARATAIMLALAQRLPVRFEIFTRVPEWFFHESYLANFNIQDCQSDIGLAQKTSLQEDLPETIRRLETLYPFDPQVLENLSRQVRASGCRLVVCDIAPLGIAVAEQAGLPSVLIENFLWDWIYAGYLPTETGLIKYIKLLEDWFRRASFHIQTEPVCHPLPCDLTCAPVSRPLRSPRAEIRARLDIPLQARTVLITMGGIETSFDYLAKLEQIPDVHFILPGASSHAIQRANLRLLPHHSGFYHPDLVAAADGIVGKLGYSTLAEACQAGTPFGFIPRAQFRESQAMKPYVLERMGGLEISELDYAQGNWLAHLPELLSRHPSASPPANGAGQIADFLQSLLA